MLIYRLRFLFDLFNWSRLQYLINETRLLGKSGDQLLPDFSFLIQCSRSAFYTVDEKTLLGYCMACGDLPSFAASETSETSLTMRLEHCRHSGYQVL